MSCELRRCRLRSMTGARCPSLRRPSWPAARPTIGSPPCGYTCGLVSRSARGATISPSGSHAATHDQARKACPVLGVASGRGVTAARSPRARATAATVTEWLELNTAPGHGIGGVCRRSSHRPSRGDEARSYDCDYEKLPTIRKGE